MQIFCDVLLAMLNDHKITRSLITRCFHYFAIACSAYGCAPVGGIINASMGHGSFEDGVFSVQVKGRANIRKMNRVPQEGFV